MGGKKKITIEEFREEIQSQGNGEYILVSDTYEGSKKPVMIKHLTCGETFPRTRDDFLDRPNRKGRRCPKCSGRKRLTIKDFKERVKELVGNEYTVLSKSLENNKDHVEMKHNSCGHKYPVMPKNFLNIGSRCPKCFGTSRGLSLQEAQEKIDLAHGKGNYTILSKQYVDSLTPMRVKHNDCPTNTEWDIDLAHIAYQVNGCPNCNKIAKEESSCIKIISRILDEKGIKYEREKVLFTNPETGMDLRHDFFLTAYNCVIEYNGKQHYQPMFGDTDKLDKQMRRDEIKERLLEENDYNYIIIPYSYRSYNQLKSVIDDLINDFNS